MKRLLYGVLGVLAIVGIAQAAQNLRQNRDGTADWMSTNSQDNAVGAAHIQLVIGLAIMNGATHYVISPLTDAKIVNAHLTRQGTALAGREIIAFQVQGITAPVQLRTRELTGAALALWNTNISDASINVGVSSNVTTYSITQVGTVTRGELINNVVERGKYITVYITGSNSTNTTGHLIITIAPK